MRNKAFRQMMKDIQFPRTKLSMKDVDGMTIKKRRTSATPAMAAPYGCVLIWKYQREALVKMKVADLKALASKENIELLVGTGAGGSVLKVDYIQALARIYR